jgi:predicted acylesterase/phospholipase RssA
MAAGYTPQEMLDALNERDAKGASVLAGFLGEPPPFAKEQIRDSAIRAFLKGVNLQFLPGFAEDKLDDIIAQHLAQGAARHLFAFVERGGWYSADFFITWLRNKLNSGQWRGAQRNFGSMTLRQFFAATQVEATVVASDTTAGRMLVLNHRTAPDCPVVMAARMSMSIPLLWDEVVWEESWGTYRNKSLAGHTIVDGGVLSNFPIELFLSSDRDVESVMGPKQQTGVLGMLIDEDMPVPPPALAAAAIIQSNVQFSELRTVQRIARLVSTIHGGHDRRVMDEYENLIVRLPAGGYGVIEFDLSSERLDALLEAGRVALADHLDRPQAAAIGAGEEMAALAPNNAVIDRRAKGILAL